jgi:hypothetical protein
MLRGDVTSKKNMKAAIEHTADKVFERRYKTLIEMEMNNGRM